MIHIHEPICACPCSCPQSRAQELLASIYIPQVSVYSQGLAWLCFAFILATYAMLMYSIMYHNFFSVTRRQHVAMQLLTLLWAVANVHCRVVNTL